MNNQLRKMETPHIQKTHNQATIKDTITRRKGKSRTFKENSER